jgi:CheY-like chemotaxis protein
LKKKILVVDDDPTSLKAVEGILILHGYEVATSAHAQDIEDKVRAFGPQLIVMDLMMPHVDGSQAVKKLQMNPALNNIPVIFLTALQTSDEERNLELEISVERKSYRTLSKPLDANALILEIRKLIHQ